ncbi:hypothetical protein BOX15_Mlig004408g2, partial [Macrostomum lignano]
LKSSKLTAIAPAIIHSTGRFKYILIRIVDPETRENVNVVRGHPKFPYHADIYDDCLADWLKQGLTSECRGGGRIEWTSDGAGLCVYGYSQGFGRANHKEAKAAIAKSYPNLNISVDNDPARY